MKWLWLFVLLIVVALVWVRIAPSPAKVWHIDAKLAPDPGRTGFVAKISPNASEEVVFGAIVAIISATPRTTVVAGNEAGRHMTFVTRSRLFGFPDYTTIFVENSGDGTELTLYGRLRFGVADSGVNKARIETWLEALKAILQ